MISLLQFKSILNSLVNGFDKDKRSSPYVFFFIWAIAIQYCLNFWFPTGYEKCGNNDNAIMVGGSVSEFSLYTSCNVKHAKIHNDYNHTINILHTRIFKIDGEMYQIEYMADLNRDIRCSQHNKKQSTKAIESLIVRNLTCGNCHAFSQNLDGCIEKKNFSRLQFSPELIGTMFVLQMMELYLRQPTLYPPPLSAFWIS